MNGVQWCIDRRCKILGIDAASKVDISGSDLIVQLIGIDPDAGDEN